MRLQKDLTRLDKFCVTLFETREKIRDKFSLKFEESQRLYT